jgi:ubiquinone/menaquinone biosynthesis C-methylase UbiE
MTKPDQAGPREYFTGLADLYSAFRPGYPAAAMAWMVAGLPSPIRAADVGCGTGISSRLLAAQGASVIGIEPNADMLDEARRRTPVGLAVDYRAGDAEHLPLDEGSVALVLCAQSFHWFDAEAALREFHRVLSPDGRVALLWNTHDEREPFTAGYSVLTRQARALAAARGCVVPSERAGVPTIGGFFVEPQLRQFSNPQPLDRDGLLGRARSASYWPREGAERDQLEGALAALFDAHQAQGRVTLEHLTEVTIARKA